MIVSLIILASLFGVAVPLYVWHKWENRRKIKRGETPVDVQEPVQECCGMHATCEKDSLLAAVSPEIIYYDDEELDIFKGRRPEDYTDAEIELFHEVLFTMLPDDIAGWIRSLQLRGIALPEIVREELILIITESRNKHKLEE